MRYRRADCPGGSYFFTVNLAERQRTLLIDEISSLRSVFREVKNRHPFYINAMVVLPDHLHAIWTLPEGDSNFAQRWGLIKAGFSKCIAKHERINVSRQQKGERGIWQRRYWEHLIRDERDYSNHIDYIHHNPVKHGYVSRAVDWPHSSIHRYIKDEVIPATWGTKKTYEGEFGE